MRFGFHISIGKGFKNVVEQALIRHCQTIQLFSRNPRGWNFKALDKDDIKDFHTNVKRADISPVFVHMPYLPNLESSDKELSKKSLSSLITELERTKTIT